MRTLRYEWKKLRGFRLLWILLLVLLCVNSYVQISTANARAYSPKEYRSCVHYLQKLHPERVKPYIEKELDAAFSGGKAQFAWAALSEMQESVERIEGYSDYLENIDKQAAQSSGLSIWGGKDTFSYRNIKKTPPAYQAMKNVTLRLDTERGIEDALHHPVTDFLGIFLLFLIVSTVMLKDREQGMMPLLYSMPNGRGALLFSKLLLITLCTIGTALLLYGENLLIGAKMYGLGDLSRPVQCIGSFYECNLPVSVGGYLLLFAGMKIAGFLVFSMVFAAVCAAAKNNLTVYAVSGGFCGIGFLLCRFVSPLSNWSLLHFVNPVQLVKVNEIIGTYKNINLFGYPVSLKITAPAAAAVFLDAAVCISALFFVHRRNQKYRSLSLLLRKHRKHRVHGQMYYVIYRSLMLQKGIVPMLAVIFAAAAFSSGFTRYYTSTDIYYEKFTTEQQGAITDDTFEFIKEKQVGYFKIDRQMQALFASENPDTLRLAELSEQTNDRAAFEQFRARYNAIRKSDADGEMFYDTGYARLFGLDGNRDDMIMNLCILIFLCLLLSPYASQDRKTGMVKILYATAAGKRGYWKHLLPYSAVCGAAAGLIFQVPYIFHILQKYGTQGLSAPLQSMTAFAQEPAVRAVRTEMIILFLLRICSAAVTAMLMSLISGSCRSPVTAYIANISIFVLPAALALLGVSFMRMVGVNPFLSYNDLRLLIPRA